MKRIQEKAILVAVDSVIVRRLAAGAVETYSNG
jgi:hypothetical protein